MLSESTARFCCGRALEVKCSQGSSTGAAPRPISSIMRSIEGTALYAATLLWAPLLGHCHSNATGAIDGGATSVATAPSPSATTAASDAPLPDKANADAGTSNQELAHRLAVAGLEVPETSAFLSTLQAALKSRDRVGVCALVSYPMRTEARRPPIANQAACTKMFDDIFNSRVSAAIERQRLETLFANSRGVMIGDGEVWFSGICSDNACTRKPIRIVTVNN
jgi:hypothetical protein